MEAMASPCSQCLENFQSFSKMRHTLLSVQATQLLEVFDPHKAFHEASPTSKRLYICGAQGRDECISFFHLFCKVKHHVSK